jgi:dTDP-4-amino-4,6-dideoxygalactose transaminase
MLVTDDAGVAEKVRAMRNVGQKEKYVHAFSPFNHRMDTLQAAILRVKLRYLESWIEARRRNAALYTELLSGSGVVTPFETSGSMHVYHLYVVRTPQRDTLRAHLRDQGIGTGIHYPIPIHLQPFYDEGGFQRGQFPVTERLCDQILSLPMFPEMTEEQVERVANAIHTYYGTRRQAVDRRLARRERVLAGQLEQAKD